MSTRDEAKKERRDRVYGRCLHSVLGGAFLGAVTGVISSVVVHNPIYRGLSFGLLLTLGTAHGVRACRLYDSPRPECRLSTLQKILPPGVPEAFGLGVPASSRLVEAGRLSADPKTKSSQELRAVK